MADYGGLDPSIVNYLGGGGAPSPDMASGGGFGLDPSIVNYVQGGAPPEQIAAAPPMPSNVPPSYGLDPSVATAVQNGFAPGPPPMSAGDNASAASAPVLPAPVDRVPNLSLPPPAPPPYPNLSTPLSPAVTSAVQNGFNPSAQNLPTDIYGSPNPKKGTLPNPETAARQADAMNYGAVNEYDAADHANAEAQTQLNDANARIQTNFNDRFDKQAAVDQANEAQYQKDRQALMTQRNAQVADWAKYKVNTDRSVGASGMIAIALSGIGDALSGVHGPNAAVAILDHSIDQRISDQWAQKNELGKVIESTDSQLTAIGATARDRREAEGLQRATLLQQQANDLKSAAFQIANPQQKARALAMAAQREQERAQIVGGIATRQASAVKDQREAQQQAFSNRIQMGHLGLAQDQFGFEKKKWQDQLDAQKSAAILAGDQAAAAQADKVQQEGVFDPRSGAPLLKPRGRAQAQQADQLEAAARLAKDPQQAQKLQQQAATLRQDAMVNGSYTIKEAAARKEVVDNIGANQGLVDVISDIKAELAKGPSAFDRTKWAELKSAGEVAKADYIAAHAGKLTSREMDAIGDAFNFDPDSMFSREANVGKMQASLGTLQKYAVADATRTLRVHGINDTWEPRATQSTAAVPLNGQTAVEAGQAATPSTAGRVERAVLTSLGGYDKGSVWDVEGRAENAGGVSGLAPDDEKRVRGEMDRFARGAAVEDQLRSKIANIDTLSPTERARVLQQAQSIGGEREASIARLTTYANSPRTAISNSTLSVLREQPALYREVLARLPDDRRKEIDQFDGVSAKLRSPSDQQLRDPVTGMTAEQQAYIQKVIAGRTH